MPSRFGVAVAGLLLLTISTGDPARCLGGQASLSDPDAQVWGAALSARSPHAPRVPIPGYPSLPARFDLHANPRRLPPRSAFLEPGDELWWDGFDLPTIDGAVYCAVEYQGSVVIGGDIREAGGVLVNNLARWDGTSWSSLGGGTDYTVTALTIYQGDLVAAGEFHTVDGVDANGIARWDGESWTAMGLGLQDEYGTPAYTLALAPYGDDLIAAGAISQSGGTPLNHVARWNGSSWQPMGAGLDGRVDALTVNSDTLYAGGDFATSGADSVSSVARWDGSSWKDVGGGLAIHTYDRFPGEVLALASYHGHLIAGGRFDEAGNSPAPNLAEWNGNTWNVPGQGSNPVSALAVLGDTLFAVSADGLDSWDGSSWTEHAGFQGYAVAIVPLGSDLFIAGSVEALDAAANPVAFDIVRYSNGIWSGLTPWNDHMRGLYQYGGFPTVWSMAAFRGHIAISGSFSHAGDPPHFIQTNGIAEWDGDRWHALPSPNPFHYYGQIQAMLGRGDTLFVGGYFPVFDTTVEYVPVSRLTGATWTPLGRSNFIPQALLIDRGSLYAAGTSAEYGDTTGIYRWDGASWRSIGTVGGSVPSVSSLVEYDGKLIAGGGFTSVDGVPAAGLAAWDGSRWEQFGTALPGYYSPYVRGMAVYQGRLIVTGPFPSPIRWNGSAWEIMGSLNAPSALPYCSGEDLFLGGYLQAFGPPRQTLSVARWDGKDWVGLGSGTNGQVNAFAASNGSLYMGGYFSMAGGKNSFGIARWDGLTAPAPSKVALLPAAPNPFRASTTFSYTLPSSGSVRVSVFDMRGREVVLLQRGSLPSGVHTVTWDGRDDEGRVLPAGVYFLRADLPGGEFSRKIVHLR